MLTEPQTDEDANSPRRTPASRLWGAAVLSFLVTFTIGIYVLTSYSRISPIDELQHIDATIKASQGRWLLPVGELIGQEAMRIEACSGIDAGFIPPPCDSASLLPRDFQELGINTAAGRPSTYYVVTGYLAQTIRPLVNDNYLKAARIGSLLFHCLGVALLAAIATWVSGTIVIGASLGVISGLIPPVLSQAVTVNPDGWAYLATATIVAITLATAGRRPPVVYAALTTALLFCALVKANFSVLVLVPVVMTVLGPNPPVSGRARVRASIPPLISAATVGMVFVTAQLWTSRSFEEVGRIPPMSVILSQSATNPWRWEAVVNQTFGGLIPTMAPGVVDILEGMTAATLSTIIGAILLGVCVVGLFSGPNPSWQIAFASSALVVLLFVPILTFALQEAEGLFFAFPQRYSYPAIPLAFLAWASIPGPRRWLFAMSAGATVVTLVASLTMTQI